MLRCLTPVSRCGLSRQRSEYSSVVAILVVVVPVEGVPRVIPAVRVPGGRRSVVLVRHSVVLVHLRPGIVVLVHGDRRRGRRGHDNDLRGPRDWVTVSDAAEKRGEHLRDGGA